MQIFCKISTTFLQKTHFWPYAKLFTRYLKNSNSLTCGFDRQMQPRVGMQIFAYYSQQTYFWPCTKLVTRYFKNYNSQSDAYDGQVYSIWAHIFSAKFSQLFCKYMFWPLDRINCKNMHAHPRLHSSVKTAPLRVGIF